MKIVLILSLLALVSSCGVKGDPLPPETPTEIGRGKPTYNRALRKVRVNDVSGQSQEDEDEDENKKKDAE
jgi:hypothetical protein